MESSKPAAPIRASDWLLLALIFALPLMNPPVAGEVIAADLLFVLLVLTITVETLSGRRALRWIPGFGPLLSYVVCLAPSLLASTNIGASLFKFATEFYLIGLAGVTALVVDSESMFRRAVLAWLAATAVVCLVAVASLAGFATGHVQWLVDYSSYGFGSLPPGDYPRLALTFVWANIACNYLTVSLGLLFLAGAWKYVRRTTSCLLFAGIALASISTISPGLGGISLLTGLWLFVCSRRDSPLLAGTALAVGIAAALLFIVALAITPETYPTAPFAIHLPGGTTLYPAPRFLTWSAALDQFVRHPLIGTGIGIDPVHVHYLTPSGNHELLTDAHNIFLSLAAQCGFPGLLGLGAIIGFAVSRTPSPTDGNHSKLRCFLLGATFLDVFVYQGLGGSFEDSRHIWVLLGLLMAASGPVLSPPDGNNRTPAAPSPC